MGNPVYVREVILRALEHTPPITWSWLAGFFQAEGHVSYTGY